MEETLNPQISVFKTLNVETNFRIIQKITFFFADSCHSVNYEYSQLWIVTKVDVPERVQNSNS